MASTIMPTLESLRDYLENAYEQLDEKSEEYRDVTSFVQTLKSQLEERLHKITAKGLLHACQLVDCRFVCQLTPNSLKDAVKYIKKNFGPLEFDSNHLNQDQARPEAGSNSQIEGFDFLDDELRVTSPICEEVVKTDERLIDEVNEMKAIKLRNVIPEEFWKDNNDRFPILYQVAKKVVYSTIFCSFRTFLQSCNDVIQRQAA
ncbi:unnamed protein product [Bursaphelenchus okinawaensis]|uniref:Dimer_Tnp_hAT domain-containing protein n=1 Tax=Bursaphelenchus okinawaensis TaxID=465554 RepID=A0A811L5X0_9BILA|nr:unnamed protein product [Bursaphelenchus okinawaensis]CAG9117228.1 unnamed protein product [Bursaphelenchus okinawaensis]